MRFGRVSGQKADEVPERLVQIADKVPKGSGADGSGQKADEVLDGSGVGVDG